MSDEDKEVARCEQRNKIQRKVQGARCKVQGANAVMSDEEINSRYKKQVAR